MIHYICVERSTIIGGQVDLFVIDMLPHLWMMHYRIHRKSFHIGAYLSIARESSGDMYLDLEYILHIDLQALQKCFKSQMTRSSAVSTFMEEGIIYSLFSRSSVLSSFSSLFQHFPPRTMV